MLWAEPGCSILFGPGQVTARRAEFVSYRPRTILNKHKRPDHWLWTRYTAYSYKGSQHRCFFCYCRERRYCPFEDLHDFGYVIQIRENAPDPLRRTLTLAPVDLVGTGDYQPAERKYGLSRRMSVEIWLELGFPVFVLERSPLVLRDLGLRQEVLERSTGLVTFRILSTTVCAAGRLVIDVTLRPLWLPAAMPWWSG